MSSVLEENGTMQEYNDVAANKYALKSIRWTMLAILGIWLLNEAGLFILDKPLIRIGVAVSETIFVMCLILCRHIDLKKWWVKYMIFLFLGTAFTVIGVTFTYHAVLLGAFPIIYSMIYPSRRLTVFAGVITVISTIIVVFAGYYYGICDANMVLLTRFPMAYYLSETGDYVVREVNRNPVRNLSVYFVLPRCIIYLALLPVCMSVTKLMKKYVQRAVQMEFLAKTDSLTKLYGRGAGETEIQHLLEDGVSGMICIADLDEFKNINDQYGHAVGDQVLELMGECMRTAFRPEDILMRFGGDEFVFFLVGVTDTNTADRCLKRLYSCVEKKTQERMPQHHISISTGGVIHRQKQKVSYRSLYRLSDSLLYQAKREGREKFIIKYLEELDQAKAEIESLDS